MGRISHHLTGKDYKKTRQRQLDEQKILHLKIRERQIQIQEDKEFLDYFKSNWRKELALGEGMTTADIGTATLAGEGDTILDTTTWVDNDSSTNVNTSGFGGATITLSGDPSPYLYNGGTFGFPISIQKYDRLIVDITTSGNQTIIYGSTANGSPELVNTTSSGTYTIDISNESNTSTWAILSQGSGTVTVSNPRFQRRAPLNALVSLDDPEASAFIRTGTSNLSSAEKQKRLRDMQEASDKYLTKMFGSNFPGTGTRVASARGPYGTPGADKPYDSSKGPQGPYSPIKYYPGPGGGFFAPGGPSVNPYRKGA